MATYFGGLGGALWVAGDVAGMIAARPLATGAWEICKVYVHPERHGSGLAQALLDVAEAHAAAAGATRLELWTDTRFERAHRFYARRGYVRGECRALQDLSCSWEWRYERAAQS